MKKDIKLVITDLDNTLYDWFEPWYRSYNVLFQDIAAKANIDYDELLLEVKKIHQKHGTAEYSVDLLFQELDILKNAHLGEDLKEIYSDIRYKFFKTKKDRLKFYPTVIETLILLKSKGCKIVAYTESMEFYTIDRIKKLGLDGVIDILFSPSDHELPEGFKEKRYYGDEYYTLQSTKHTKLPIKHKKPDVSIIGSILNVTNVEPNEVIYIGDSLVKDIKMAQEAGVIDVYAKYGVSHHKEEYELLKKVTHWTDEEVEKEKQLTKEDVQPSYVLSASFSELLEHFNFVSMESDGIQQDDLSLDHLIKLWDRAVDVQKHFNDIELKIRQLAVSITGVLLGVFLAFSKQIDKIGVGNDVSYFSTGFIFLAIIWGIFFLMDAFWYHPLLKGAVLNALELEKLIQKKIPIKGLSTTIGEKSPIIFLCIKIDSTKKLYLFYILFIGLFLGCAKLFS